MLEELKNVNRIQVDTETNGFDPHVNELLTIQLGSKALNKYYVIDLKSITDEELNSIKSFLEIDDKDRIYLFQNAKFDLRFFYKKNIYIKRVYDTFLAECILQTGLPQKETALDVLAFKYAGAKLDKSIRSYIHIEGLSDRVIKYAAEDVMHLEPIMDEQIKQLKQANLLTVAELENEVVKVFARMEYNGVPFNATKWLKVAEITEQQSNQCIKELDEIVQNEPLLYKYIPKYIQSSLFDFEERKISINWSSPQQKLDVIRSLNIPVESTGDRELQRNKRKHILLPKLIEYNKSTKLATAFGKNFLDFINPNTKRLHPNYWQILNTGRVSVKEPNVNQIPSKGELGKEIRACFEAPEGYKIVGGDYSGMELRIIAELSNDPLWVTAFQTGQDLHSVLCAATFNIPITDAKKPFPPKPEMTYRDVQKTINFGLAYGMSEFKLADTMQISVEESRNIINKFFSVVPKVKEFLDFCGNYGKKWGEIRTPKPFQRRRLFPEWANSQDRSNPNSFKLQGEIERAAKNTPIQGCNGDIIKQALVMLQNEIDKNNWPVEIILAVYDEIRSLCKDDFCEEFRIKKNEIMIKAAQTVLKQVPVEVDCTIHQCWTK